MPVLKAEVKALIVTALACYDTPSQVAEQVKEEFGLDLPRQHIETYNPTRHQGKNLSKSWRALFDKTREEFKAGLIDIPIAQRHYRLKVMQRIMVKAESSGNRALALQTIEQAAKETGDVYVNHPRGGSDNSPDAGKLVIEGGLPD